MSILIVLIICALIYVAYSAGLKDIARDRKYKSGTIWCFWRWTDVDSEYILRLHVVKTPWFAVCLHWIQKPDAEPWLHDHPVSFLSLILRGGYAEKRWSKKRGLHIKLNSWFNFVRASADDRHTIILTRKGTLTLCFMGPKTREWGFHMPGGWIVWKDYYKRLRAGEDMRAAKLWAGVYGGGNYGEGAYGSPEIYNRAVEFSEAVDALTNRYSTMLGAPDKTRTIVDEETREIDGAFAVSREDFYKNVQIEFGDEDPTQPYGKGADGGESER